jgi:hypothetical protein
MVISTVRPGRGMRCRGISPAPAHACGPEPRTGIVPVKPARVLVIVRAAFETPNISQPPADAVNATHIAPHMRSQVVDVKALGR